MKVKQIKKDDIYKTIKICEAFDGDFVEYQSNSKNDKPISSYLNNIRQYSKKLIDNKKKKGEWKIQLNMKFSFISSKNFNETRNMHSKSDNLEL